MEGVQGCVGEWSVQQDEVVGGGGAGLVWLWLRLHSWPCVCEVGGSDAR